MGKRVKYAFIVFLFVAGCTRGIGYINEDIAAIVKGEEITVGELRLLYPDEEIEDRIEDYIKIKLVIQEVERMNISIPESSSQYKTINLPPKNYNDLISNSVREFAESQSKKLGMNPEEFHEKYQEIVIEQNAYMVTYILEVLGEPGESESELRLYTDKVNEMLNELFEQNKDEIEILIN